MYQYSEWTIENTKVKDDFKILDIGYGGGSNIKNLVNLGQNVSEEYYKTTTDLKSIKVN
jgi:hypothetical protein